MDNARPFPWSHAKKRLRERGVNSPAVATENAPTDFTEVARSVRLLKIDGFSLMPTTIGQVDHMLMDDHFVATRWNIYGYDWEIRFYPAMKVARPRMFDTWLAVELAFPSNAGTGCISANLSCRLVDPRGELNPSKEDSASGVSGPSQENIVAFLVARRDLAESGYLKHDSVTVECTITVLMESPGVTALPAKEVQVPSSDLHRDLAELQQSETGADVTFLVSGESFAAHKLILAARSPVFKAEFFGHMEEKSSQRIHVKGLEAAAFKAMLKFIYTDTVPELDHQESEDVTALAQHLLAAADRYGLDRLKLICEGKLSDSIQVETAATTLALAEQHNRSQLKAKCIEFIVSTPEILDDVLATDGFAHLVASCPLVIRDLLMSARGRKRSKHDLMMPSFRF